MQKYVKVVLLYVKYDEFCFKKMYKNSINNNKKQIFYSQLLLFIDVHYLNIK